MAYILLLLLVMMMMMMMITTTTMKIMSIVECMDIPGRDRFVLRQCRHKRGAVSLPLPCEKVALSLQPVGADVLDNLVFCRLLSQDGSCGLQQCS
jgi:hypothetical protein